MGASLDLYDNPDAVHAFLEEHVLILLDYIKKMPARPGRLAFIPMHKGMDGFLSDDQYQTYYWSYLLRVVDALLDVGMIPYLYTEGKYNTRIKFLAQLPPGKTVVHFEDVDMTAAKKTLSGVACITGNYPYFLLTHGTKQQVIDEAKRLLDICAPGGGYMFDFDGGLYECKRENVEALFETVKEYGRYR
jgi:uroporphyrinogen-III decarboxylase